MSAVKAMMSSRPVAYYPELARAVGGIAPALFFQQIAHWQGKNPDGWVYRTQEELEEELAMSPKVQASAREHLLKRGLLEEKRDGMPRRLYYRPVWDNLESALQTLPMASTDSPDGQVQTSPSGDTTLKNSNENKEHPPVAPPKGGPKTLKGEDSIDYAVLYEDFIEDDPLGAKIARLLKLAASENKTKKMRYSRAVAEFIEPLRMLREDGYSDVQLAAGLDAALKAQAPNINYVKKVAKSYEPDSKTDASGSEAEETFGTPEEVITYIVEKTRNQHVKGLAHVMRRFDFTTDEQPPYPIQKQLGGTDNEIWSVLNSIQTLARRAQRERGVA